MMEKLFPLLIIGTLLLTTGCNNKIKSRHVNVSADSSIVNTNHLDHLYLPVSFPTKVKASGIYIYAEAPDYHLVDDSDEGYTCVDDVSRAALVYLRHKNFSSDTALQNKVYNLLQFILEMQSENGYFYNFLFLDNSINKTGQTSINIPGWWSWRALQTLTEAMPFIKSKNDSLAGKMDHAINRMIKNIKSDLIPLPLNTKNVQSIKVPQWLPAGSATDQAAILILALINYDKVQEDTDIKNFIRKLADGIVMMQHNDPKRLFSCFLSWENVWHAYGSDQAFALIKAGVFLKDTSYVNKALMEVDTFYPWLLNKGMLSSFTLEKKENELVIADEKKFDQIAYGIRPMIFAATEAFEITGEQKYVDIAARLTAWFFGVNDAKEMMYDKNSGRCFDGIVSETKVNRNSGAESTIEALLAIQKIEKYPLILAAVNKYQKQ